MRGSQVFRCGTVTARITPFSGLYLLDFLTARHAIPSGEIQVLESRGKKYAVLSPVGDLGGKSPESYIYYVHPRLRYKIRNLRDKAERRFSFPPSLCVE